MRDLVAGGLRQPGPATARICLVLAAIQFGMMGGTVTATMRDAFAAMTDDLTGPQSSPVRKLELRRMVRSAIG